MNKFAPTVANAIVRDVVADTIVIKAKTLLNSGYSVTTSNTEITGGEFSQLLYDYNYGRRIEVNLEDAVYNEQYFAINFGKSIENSEQETWITDEVVTLDGGGVGTVAETVFGDNVYVELSNGTISTVSQSNKEFTVLSEAGKDVKVSYKHLKTIDNFDMDASTFPKTYELTLEVKVFDKDGLKEINQFVFPEWKPSGAFDLSFASETPVTSTITGKCLADENGSYGKSFIIDKSGSTISYSALAITNPTVELSVAETEKLNVLGIRNGNYLPVPLTNDKFNFTSETPANATVDANGIITAVQAGTSVITVELKTDTNIKDYATVTVS